MKLVLFCISFLVFCVWVRADEPVSSLAILGDSLSTGALTHRKMGWDLEAVEDALKSPPELPVELDQYTAEFQKIVPVDGDVVPPTRYWETLAEYPDLSFGDKITKGAEITAKRSYVGGFIDIEEYSWGYLLGRKEAIEPESIQLAGEIGARAQHAEKQARRLMRGAKNKLPEQIVVGFTGNDACAADPSSESTLEGARKQFGDKIFEGLRVFLEKGEVEEESSSEVFVMGHLPIMQLITNPSILTKKVTAFGKQMTCEEFRSTQEKDIPDPKNSDILGPLLKLTKVKNLPPVTVMCKQILTTQPDDAARIALFEKLLESYRQGAQDAVKRANQYRLDHHPQKPITFSYLKKTESMSLVAEDVANDCFHLSLVGQQKLASLLFSEIQQP